MVSGMPAPDIGGNKESILDIRNTGRFLARAMEASGSSVPALSRSLNIYESQIVSFLEGSSIWNTQQAMSLHKKYSSYIPGATLDHWLDCIEIYKSKKDEVLLKKKEMEESYLARVQALEQDYCKKVQELENEKEEFQALKQNYENGDLDKVLSELIRELPSKPKEEILDNLLILNNIALRDFIQKNSNTPEISTEDLYSKLVSICTKHHKTQSRILGGILLMFSALVILVFSKGGF